MNRIITINRQFGSGGRELGKRLAEQLGIAYYDNEIITEIANRSGLAYQYVNSIVEKKPIMYFPITIGRTFLGHAQNSLDFNTRIYAEQHSIVKELAERSDCVVIGRCSDYILREMNPFRIYVYADMPHRIKRCTEKAPEGEQMSPAAMEKHIAGIDKERSEYYRHFTGRKWEDMTGYDLCINTSGMEIKKLIPQIIGIMECKEQ